MARRAATAPTLRAAAAAERLRGARPTAVNLAWAVDRVLAAALAARRPSAVARARRGRGDPRRRGRRERARSRSTAPTCSPARGGSSRTATPARWPAAAAARRSRVAIELAHRDDGVVVLACETRPLLQGARLTVWELRRAGIPHELLVDGAAAGLMRRGEVDAVIVGCDRVAANGDVANKVGTYAHALAARAAGDPVRRRRPDVDDRRRDRRRRRDRHRGALRRRGAPRGRRAAHRAPTRRVATRPSTSRRPSSSPRSSPSAGSRRRRRARPSRRCWRRAARDAGRALGDLARGRRRGAARPGRRAGRGRLPRAGLRRLRLGRQRGLRLAQAAGGARPRGRRRGARDRRRRRLASRSATASSSTTTCPAATCRRCERGHETLCEQFRATALDPGGFAERVRLSAPLVGELLALGDLDPVAGTFVEPLGCVLRALDRAGLRGGRRAARRRRGLQRAARDRRRARARRRRGLGARAARGPPPRSPRASARCRTATSRSTSRSSRPPNAAAIAGAAAALAPGGTLCLYATTGPGTPAGPRHRAAVPARDHRLLELVGGPGRHARRATS